VIGGDSVLALIPARGGSKGLARKNLRLLGGRPLIAWTIKAARASRCIDRVVLSTEDEEIAEVARAAGCDVPFRRPLALACDEAPVMAVIAHALDALAERYDWLVLLQPTSPLRLPEDIDGSLALCIEREVPCCVSVCEAPKSPYWMFTTTPDGRMQPVLPPAATGQRRQDLPAAWALNGAVYAARTSWLVRQVSFLTPETLAYPMPKVRSVDIDDECDLAIAEALLPFAWPGEARAVAWREPPTMGLGG
jgi:CMP-N,N'-diacetyllegionaminic acid synthase